MPGSGPRCHDARHRLIAPLARRGTLLPPLHRHCPGNAEGAGNAGDHAKLSPSTAAATTKSRPRPSVRRRQPRPAHPRPKPPPHQIPIDPAHQPPRVPSWGAFGRRPQNRWIAHDRPASETLHRGGRLFGLVRRSAVRATAASPPPTATANRLALRRVLHRQHLDFLLVITSPLQAADISDQRSPITARKAAFSIFRRRHSPCSCHKDRRTDRRVRAAADR